MIGEEGIGEKYDIRARNKRTTNFQTLLRQRNFLNAFIQFLINDWNDETFASFYGGKTIRFNFDKCYRFQIRNGVIHREIDHDFTCKHDSTDIKMVYHITKLMQGSRVKIIAQDGDPVIILLGNLSNINPTIEIFAELGSNRSTLLNVNEIHNNLGDKICECLPAYHALTGCKYNPAFFSKSKKRELSILQKNTRFQEALIKLMQVDSTSEVFSKIFTVLEEYVCQIYAIKTGKDINLGRMEIFDKHYKLTSTNEKLIAKSFINFEASKLPPCRAELKMQVLRAMYISKKWRSAFMKNSPFLDPEMFGWTIENGIFEFVWFEGDQSPIIQDIISEDTCDLQADAADETSEDFDESSGNCNIMFITIYFMYITL